MAGTKASYLRKEREADEEPKRNDPCGVSKVLSQAMTSSDEQLLTGHLSKSNSLRIRIEVRTPECMLCDDIK